MFVAGDVIFVAVAMTARNVRSVRAAFDPAARVVVINDKLSERERWTAIGDLINEILEAPLRPRTRPRRQRPGG